MVYIGCLQHKASPYATDWFGLGIVEYKALLCRLVTGCCGWPWFGSAISGCGYFRVRARGVGCLLHPARKKLRAPENFWRSQKWGALVGIAGGFWATCAI
jgi:hypothetical protein